MGLPHPAFSLYSPEKISDFPKSAPKYDVRLCIHICRTAKRKCEYSSRKQPPGGATDKVTPPGIIYVRAHSGAKEMFFCRLQFTNIIQTPAFGFYME